MLFLGFHWPVSQRLLDCSPSFSRVETTLSSSWLITTSGVDCQSLLYRHLTWSRTPDEIEGISNLPGLEMVVAVGDGAMTFPVFRNAY